MRLVAFSAAVLAALTLSAASASGAAVKEVHKTVPLDPDGRVSIETYKGWIDLQTWDRPEVDVSARVEPDESGRDARQAEKVNDTEVRIEGSGRSVRIESDYGAVRRHGFLGIFGGGGTLPFVRYAIRMPRGATLEVKDYKSRSRIAGLAAGLDFETYKGKVEVSGMDGAVRLRTYKGDVHVDFARFGESEFETYKGDIEIGTPKGAGFALDADLGRRGRFDSDFEVAVRAFGRHSREDRRRGTVNGGGPPLSLQTYRGTFRLRTK